MDEAEPSEGFTIRDRRRQAESEPPTQAASRPESPARSREPDRGPAAQLAGRADPEHSLVGLFMMLGSSAVIALGDAPDPVTGHRQCDLPGAADAIDLLALLREKTEGHRTAEETQVLDDLLYDLQLRYVSATKRSG